MNAIERFETMKRVTAKMADDHSCTLNGKEWRLLFADAAEWFAQIAESWTPDQWEIHPREDFARKEIAAAIRRA